jgi:hypothetical protein
VKLECLVLERKVFNVIFVGIRRVQKIKNKCDYGRSRTNAIEIEGNVGNVKARRENTIESEVDQLSEYDNSSESSDSLSAAEELKEEYDGQNEANNHIQNKDHNFLFAPGRTRSGRVVKTSARAMLWM